MNLDTSKPISSVSYNGVDVPLQGGSGEISITENGTHDVTKYATANVNVQSAPVLLWTNASPTSSFAAQTVSVSGAGYDAYLVEFKANAWTPIIHIRKGASGQELVARSDANYRWTRTVSNVSDTGITFSSCTGSRAGDSYCIVTRIWGVKFTL